MSAATAVLIAVFGGLGSLARWLVASVMIRTGPWGTLTVNVLGAAAIGLVVAMLDARGLTATRWAPVIVTGFLGGFTTFSALALETVTIIERHHWGWALGYVTVTMTAGVGVCALGLAAGRT